MLLLISEPPGIVTLIQGQGHRKAATHKTSTMPSEFRRAVGHVSHLPALRRLRGDKGKDTNDPGGDAGGETSRARNSSASLEVSGSPYILLMVVGGGVTC